jgi:hypothetical protein
MGEDWLEALARERARLQRLLALQPPSFWRRRLRRRPDDELYGPEGLSEREQRLLRDPEVRKNIAIIAADIADAIDLHRRVSLGEAALERLAELVTIPTEVLSLDNLLDTRRSVEEVLLERADLQLLQQRTAAEYAEEAATMPTWRQLYGSEPPELLNDRAGEPGKDIQAFTRARLQRLVEVRFSLYRPYRARRELRTIYLWYLAPVVALAGLLFGIAVAFQAAVGAVLLAAAAGAAGASLSGILRFRDEIKLGAQVREFVPFYFVQFVVGAIFGLLVVLVSATGWLNLDASAAQIGAVSFAAGFSEPFAVGIVAKLAERAGG